MCDSNCGCGCNSTTIPKGPQGTPGTNGVSATIEVGEVNTGLPGTDVIITNVGPNSFTGIFDFTIPAGATGAPGTASAVTVKDAQGNVVTSCTEIRFTDADALVTDLGGGIAEVNFVPPSTTWVDVQNLDYYISGSELFRPQYTIEGNKISFRGILFVPLQDAGVTVPIADANDYRGISGVTLGSADLSVVTNANSVSGQPQGRFFTSDVVTLKNLLPNAIPQDRDIIFDNVNAYRRYLGPGDIIYTYRSIVSIRIGSVNTAFYNVSTPSRRGIGCISIFSPFNTQYGGTTFSPYGNDPLSLLISNVTVGIAGNDYITAKDDTPWTVPSAGGTNPFSVNAHSILDLGGFIINLEGLSGYLN
jgi:hypothetical protein